VILANGAHALRAGTWALTISIDKISTCPVGAIECWPQKRPKKRKKQTRNHFLDNISTSHLNRSLPFLTPLNWSGKHSKNKTPVLGNAISVLGELQRG